MKFKAYAYGLALAIALVSSDSSAQVLSTVGITNGFPITLGSTSITQGSTHVGLAGLTLTGSTYNGLTINSTSGTFALANSKTLTVSNSFTFAGTDGTTFTFPTTSKTVLANDFSNAAFPGSTINDVVAFNTGGTLQDSGVLFTNIVQGPASAVSGNIPSFNGTGGKTLQDSGYSTGFLGAISGKNRLINGNFPVSQYNGTSTITPSVQQYLIDRWAIAFTQASKLSFAQNLNSIATPAGASQNYAGFQTASAFSVGAGDYFALGQYIEANNVGDLQFGTANAQAVTISFWSRSSVTGTHGGSLCNYALTRCYPYTYSIPVANTWTREAVTIPGDTAGTWVTIGTGGAMRLYFGLGAGATNSGTAGSWASAQYLSATGAVSVVGTLNATWYVTDVQLEAGSTATAFDRRLYSQALADCQRYYQVITLPVNAYFAVGMATGTATASAVIPLPGGPMRSVPSITLPSAGSAAGQMTFLTPTATIPGTIGTIALGSAATNQFYLNASGYTAMFTAGNASILFGAGPVSITASAEL